MNNDTLQADLQEYKSACCAANELYAKIGNNENLARQFRNERWEANKRKREAAENVLMSMLGSHKPALQRAGLVNLYQEMSAGKHQSDVAMFEIVEATCKFFLK